MAESMREQLAKNIRLRVGLALIAGIVGTYLVLDLSEQVAKKQKEYRRLSVQLAQAKQQATDTAWLNRQKEATDALNELRSHDWVDSSHGLIQSKWNDSLQLILNQEKVSAASVALSESAADANTNDENKTGVPGMTVMKAKLRFESVPKSLYNILQIIDTNKQSMVVESLSYNWLGATGRAEMNIKAFSHLSDQAIERDSDDKTQPSADKKTDKVAS